MVLRPVQQTESPGSAAAISRASHNPSRMRASRALRTSGRFRTMSRVSPRRVTSTAGASGTRRSRRGCSARQRPNPGPPWRVEYTADSAARPSNTDRASLVRSSRASAVAACGLAAARSSRRSRSSPEATTSASSATAGRSPVRSPVRSARVPPCASSTTTTGSCRAASTAPVGSPEAAPSRGAPLTTRAPPADPPRSARSTGDESRAQNSSHETLSTTKDGSALVTRGS